ncbi:MAG: AAA family ATPase [Terracidiphilus sp.]|nr:AAA family ATPase [Terracidiphilus sp.]
MSPAPIAAAASLSWQDMNQRSLVREFALLRRRLGDETPADPNLASEAEPMSAPAAIDNLCAIFDLSPFERELVLLCAGVEMDSALAGRCAELLGSGSSRPARGLVTFSLAMATLNNPHWSAISASAPLRRFRLLTLEPGHGITAAALNIDERVLHYLAGSNRLDPRLEDLLFLKQPPEWMDDDHFRLATETLGGYSGDTLPGTILHLCGDDPLGQESVASLLAHRSGRALYVLRHEDTPAAGAELEQLLHLWMRERLLLPAFLLLQWGSESPSAAARQLAERIPGALIVASREPLRLHRPVESYQVDKPGPSAQQRLWQDALGVSAQAAPALLGQVAQQFRLSAETIVSIAASVAPAEPVTAEGAETPSTLSARLWNACRLHTRPRLEGFAERIVPNSTWDDLVLPDAQKLVLRQIAAQSRNRMTVYETWGFAARGPRGLGISALFAGPSGTGKTLAAEVLAADLHLDLYRIDLSAVVSKYIGETEKNLKQVFDAAETGGCLLLFDEADALFGKRSEVKDSHDRYANIEVGYLLQRMESFQGLAILTTNLKTSLDKSFQRRLRFTVDFPFPDAAQRRQIWERVFPAQAPTRDLDSARLATLNMTGGNIRNIALNAAFLAADCGEPVSMTHLLQAAQLEAVKSERPISEMEIRRWV